MEILKIFLIGVAATIFFMLGFQFFIRWKVGKLSGKEFTRFGKKVVVYFYSPSCGVCKRMEPVIASLSKKAKVKRINVAKEDGLKIAKELGIMGTPTTIVVKDGKIAKVFVGFQREDKILKEVSDA